MNPVPDRLKALRALMRGRNVPALLLTSPANRRYYSGFEAGDTPGESSGALLITARGQYLLTDSRYTEAARTQAPLFQIVTCQGGLARGLAALPALKKAGTLSLEPAYLSLALRDEIKKARPDLRLAPAPFEAGSPRAEKSPAELGLVRKALAITEAAVSALWEILEPGLTEREAAFFLENEFRRLGAEGPAFETIVASGPNAAKPHAEPGRKKIRPGETVIVDCGARFKGYCADITRTKITGRPKKWQREIYAIVKEAQDRALALLAPGRPAAEVDRAAREFIAARGYGPYFGHSLGHGVGLFIHEAPRLSPRSRDELRPGHIVTVEPGIYLPGRGGVRLEQLALVTDQGARILNRNQDFYSF
ncbi:MAG: Xaa-Pro peptidase family protein [Candidatus Adiutrix sp.]|jgi:Xaa-Pro aminopeptidase|nr:Xaa-Pro peptidase family protein [Candidatus Adiutrix sp.]